MNEIKTVVNGNYIEEKGRLDDLVYTEVVTLGSNMTIAGNAQPVTQVKQLSARAGYTAVMATVDNTYNGVINLWYCSVNSTNNTISWRIRNMSSSQVTGITVNVKVLYVRTSSVSV